MKKQFNIEEVKDFIKNTSEETKFYIGADSQRFQKRGEWYAEYSAVVVVHIDGNKGCKIFGYSSIQRDYDNKKRPFTRLMNEVYMASGLYLDLVEVIGNRYCEVHLDINPNEKYASSGVIQQAIGYVRGVCNITPKVKPESFAASHCADHFPLIRMESPKHVIKH